MTIRRTASFLSPCSLTLARRYQSSQTPSYQNITYSNPSPAVGLLTLNRPKALNALSSPLFTDINDILSSINSSSSSVKCLVLTGSEKSFAAGADITEMAERSLAEVVWEREVGKSNRVCSRHCRGCRAPSLPTSRRELGYNLQTGGSDNHLVLWDLRPIGLTGSKVEKICDLCHITINKNAVSGDTSAQVPGGVRLGTSALTSRSMGPQEMVEAANFMHRAVQIALVLQEEAGSKQLKDFLLKATQGDGQGKKLLEQLHLDVGEFSHPRSGRRSAGPAVTSEQHSGPHAHPTGHPTVLGDHQDRPDSLGRADRYLLSGAEKEIYLPLSRRIHNFPINSTSLPHAGSPDYDEEASFLAMVPDLFVRKKEYIFRSMERDTFPRFLRAKALGNLTPMSSIIRLSVGLVAIWIGLSVALSLIFIWLESQAVKSARIIKVHSMF
ncbi:glycine hydroxymethyltransferase [Puccinia graminis f. sp. tritici CRL 75-36-700-3]|uniref:Glycine hydroxymethyltransferase n=1 Tax=Puccinia graminis f. sp. tritici (strain CRL 75-36-700-3 / race SCCL) TaxID=418459 RepID=E3K747_PUCGT|nr:glycine hydroxymethyltransferase [Puccinia graminis f. sp. tritici CRL 75-36-700-3]EFP80113.2 glycine hydroxymethyltransferase [Puccinia graminis f. sp. tritici CRL 75-36-700-3]